MTGAAARFSETASAYLETMSPSLRPVAAAVVRHAKLRPGERVLDVGTGPGPAAAMALGDGRQVTGIDAAPRMVEIARRAVSDATFEEMDFAALRFDDAQFDVVLAVHALLFASDPAAVLGEWRRVTAGGGRLSLSVPGPADRTPSTLYAEVYRRVGFTSTADYPTVDTLSGWARAAGWVDVATQADPDVEIVLPDEAAFRTWRSIGARSPRAEHLSDAEQRDLTDAMLAITPRDADGAYRIPFGALYLTARTPSAGPPRSSRPSGPGCRAVKRPSYGTP